MLGCMAFLGLNFCWWNQSVPPSASHKNIRLGVVWGIEWNRYHLTTCQSQLWMLHLATLGSNFPLFCPRARPNLLQVTCCLTFLFSSPPEFHLHSSSIPSQSTATESIPHDQNYSTAASSRKSTNHPHLLPAIAGIHLKAVSNCSATK